MKAEELKKRLKTEREKFQNEPVSVWSKSPDQITLDDALEIVGLNEVPPLKILHKLHLAVEQEKNHSQSLRNIRLRRRPKRNGIAPKLG